MIHLSLSGTGIEIFFGFRRFVEEIGAAITGLGYPATLDSVDPLSEKETFAYMESQRKGSGSGGGGCCGGGSAPAASPSCPGGGQSGCGLPSATPANTSKDI